MLQSPHPKSFYALVRRDGTLGAVFAAHVQNWDEHLDKMRAFWSPVSLRTVGNKEWPMEGAGAAAGGSGRTFSRLQRSRSAARENCPAGAASLFIDRAARIAESLKSSIAVWRRNDARIAAG
jgi:hemoglobin